MHFDVPTVPVTDERAVRALVGFCLQEIWQVDRADVEVDIAFRAGAAAGFCAAYALVPALYQHPPVLFAAAAGIFLAAHLAGVTAQVRRAVLVGLAVSLAMALWPGVHVTPHAPLAILWFGIGGSAFLALLGVLTSIWAEKFDHAAAVTNFVVAPLSLLSGTFYSVDSLAPVWRAISHANPFFYIISGFRYGFLGVADSPVWSGAVVVLAIDVVLGLLCYTLLRRGWRLKN